MSIIHKHIDEIFEYDGSQINPSWAFQEFGIYGSSIITWIGPVNITPDNLKDFADVGLEIKSNYMVNFICEFYYSSVFVILITFMYKFTKTPFGKHFYFIINFVD